jgi:hypothetical protein
MLAAPRLIRNQQVASSVRRSQTDVYSSALEIGNAVESVGYERAEAVCPRLAYGIQEVARSIRVSSTSKITHYLVLG